MVSSKYYVSRGTLYNTLRLMKEIGIIDKFFQKGNCYYEVNRAHQNSYMIVNQKDIQEIELEKELEQFLISHVEKKYNVSIKKMKITFFQD